MKNLTTIRYYLFVFVSLISISSYAQIGIGTNDPDTSAILELRSDSLGVLMPRMTSTAAQAMMTPAEGLMLYDTDENMVMFYGKSSSVYSWYGVSPWRYRENVSDPTNINLYLEPSINSVNIGTSTPLVDNQLTIENNVVIGGTTGDAPQKGMLLKEDAEFQSDVTVTNTSSATIVEGAGTVPLGGVIMWSGNSGALPDGYVLCDGGAPVGGITIPDLRGRFLVGVDPSANTSLPSNTADMVTNYASVGNTGGLNQVTLDTTQLPVHDHGGLTVDEASTAHTHSFDEIRLAQDKKVQNDNDGDGDYRLGDIQYESRNTGYAGIHKHTVYGEGNGQPSDNRPQYFTLAFIIRIQ